MGSVIYGYVMTAGVVRFRERVRLVSSSVGALKELMQEFDRFEFSSESFRLWPRTGQVERETRSLEVSMPEDGWRIFDNIAPLWNEMIPRIGREIFLGYFMLFGLWWLKEFLLQSGNPVPALKQLLLQLQTSGEFTA